MTGVLVQRNAVGWTFALNGAVFASLVTRFPDVRRGLGLGNGGLGLLLLAGAVGSLVALAVAGRLIEWRGAGAVVRVGGVLATLGLLTAAVGATVLALVSVTAVGLLIGSVGVSVWDVAMNVEGAQVERRLERTIMPRFHAGWSVGSITGSAVGIPVVAAGVPMGWHLGMIAAVAVAVLIPATRAFEPAAPAASGAAGGPARSPWLEPRTLAIGVMVLAFAGVEGAANDWLTLAFLDGYAVPQWTAVTAYALFVVAMTSGRLAGVGLLDRLGRTPVLLVCAGAAGAGSLLTAFGGSLPVALVGVVVWGLGASLGFPVGMSAAADDPIGAARRVAVVSTIGYGAFLVLPPFLGWVGDRIGTLHSLLVVSALMVPAAISLLAARPRAR